MSVINKKPFIAELLNGLQSVQVTELYKCLNGKQSIVKLKLGAPGIATLKTTNHGINHVLLEIDNLRVVPGYLIWDGTKFVFISYGTGKKLGQAIIKDGTYEIEVIKEDLTIEELRRVIYDTFDVKEGGGMSLEEINEAIADGSIEATRMVHWTDIESQVEILLMRMLKDFIKPGDILEKDDCFYFICGIQEDSLCAFKIADDGITYYFYGTWNTSTGVEWIDVDWTEEQYALLGNIPEPGTKLYKHEIHLGAFNKIIYIYNNESTPYPTMGYIQNVVHNSFFVKCFYDAFAGGGSPLVVVTDIGLGTQTQVLYGLRADGTAGTETVALSSTETLTDTVTQL